MIEHFIQFSHFSKESKREDTCPELKTYLSQSRYDEMYNEFGSRLGLDDLDAKTKGRNLIF